MMESLLDLHHLFIFVASAAAIAAIFTSMTIDTRPPLPVALELSR